jgi:hypothetical protein
MPYNELKEYADIDGNAIAQIIFGIGLSSGAYEGEYEDASNVDMGLNYCKNAAATENQAFKVLCYMQILYYKGKEAAQEWLRLPITLSDKEKRLLSKILTTCRYYGLTNLNANIRGWSVYNQRLSEAH